MDGYNITFMPDDYAAAYEVAKKLRDAGFQALFAGGWVRDRLLKIVSDDIDVATDASPEQIEALFPKTVLVGAQFGVVRVLWDKSEIEVATFRIDEKYADGRHPESIILTKSAQEDAKRRDFTINGLFYDPFENQVLDYVGGKEDLALGLVKAIGNPEARFTEDKLRMVRAVRFAVTLGFSIEKNTLHAIQNLASTLRSFVSPERLWQELKKIHKAQKLADALRMLREVNLYTELFSSQSECPKNGPELNRIALVESAPKTAPLASLVTLLVPSVDALTTLFRLSCEEQKIVFKTLQLALDSKKKQTDAFWARWYSDCIFFDILPQALLLASGSLSKEVLKSHCALEKELSFWVDLLRKKKPLVTSEMLKERGVLPGKEMGQLLKQAEEIAINERIKDPKILLKRLLQ